MASIEGAGGGSAMAPPVWSGRRVQWVATDQGRPGAAGWILRVAERVRHGPLVAVVAGRLLTALAFSFPLMLAAPWHRVAGLGVAVAGAVVVIAVLPLRRMVHLTVFRMVDVAAAVAVSVVAPGLWWSACVLTVAAVLILGMHSPRAVVLPVGCCALGGLWWGRPTVPSGGAAATLGCGVLGVVAVLLAAGVLVEWGTEVQDRVLEFLDVVHQSPDLIFILRVDGPDTGRIVQVNANPAAVAVVALWPSVDDFAGWIVALGRQELLALVRRTASTGISGYAPDVRALSPDRSREIIVDCETLALPGGTVGVVMSDQTVPVRTGEALTHQARHDSLTGLPNRLAFAESLQSLRGCRASVLLLDLDRFKDVNDILGHDQGDRLLEVVGKRLRSGCGGHEVFRLGGDEFAVVVPEAGQVEAVELASLVRSRLSEVVRVGDLSISVRCSVGVAVDAGGVTPGELLRHADVAMYAAKRTASGVVAFDPALDEGSMDRLELSGRIPAGLLNGEFVVFYQPIVHLDSGRIVGMEALVRWDHPERGLLPPAQFLDLVKVGGYLPRLTRWVLGEALTEVRICREWCPELRVSVNLSALNLFQPELVRETLSMLQDAEVAEGALIFELTEDDLIDDPDTALAVVEELAAAGIGVSIDDFGTGFSSLAYLNRLPIDEIKIDRTFIAGLPDAGTHETLSRSIIDLAHGLHLSVVAEGVEEAAARDWLLDAGCDRVQGFLIARPLPASEFRALLREQAIRPPSADFHHRASPNR